MRDLFEVDDPLADLSYVNTRAPRHRGAELARNSCDELWREFANPTPASTPTDRPLTGQPHSAENATARRK